MAAEFGENGGPVRITVGQRGGVQGAFPCWQEHHAVIRQAGNHQLGGVINQVVPVPGGGRERTGTQGM